MWVLDTNHITELGYNTPRGLRLLSRIESSGATAATTIVTVEEQLRGWLAEISRRSGLHQQLPAYERLQERIEFFSAWLMLPFDSDAADLVEKLRRQGIRIGTMDLKIAAITMVHDATLLTRNTVDFSKVPGLRFENWLD